MIPILWVEELTEHGYRSEDSLWELVLSFHYMASVLGLWQQSPLTTEPSQ